MKIIGLMDRSGMPSLPTQYSRMVDDATEPMLVAKRINRSAYTCVLVVIDDMVPDTSVLIREARTLAPGAKMILLYVLQFSLEDRLRYVDASEEKLAKVRMQQHEEALDAMSAILCTAGVNGSDVATAVEHGDFATAALKLGRELNVDLTVIGTRPTSALRRFFCRSPAKELIEKAACDVLAVPVELASKYNEVKQ